MTDNEIIKALECCFGGEGLCPRQQCPFYEKCKNDESLAMYALDLIKRQKAEIERLQRKYELSETEREANVKGFTESLATAKAEAIKEFAKRANGKFSCYVEQCGEFVPYGMADIIDNLVKEMTEDEGK